MWRSSLYFITSTDGRVVARWFTYLHTKNPNLGKFGGPWNGKSWHILWPLGIVCCHLVSLSRLGIFAPRKIWQPWMGVWEGHVCFLFFSARIMHGTHVKKKWLCPASHWLVSVEWEHYLLPPELSFLKGAKQKLWSSTES
jgi:hypothetical protein